MFYDELLHAGPIGLHRLPPDLRALYSCVANRINDPASQRVIYTGTLADTNGKRAVSVIWQMPGAIRIVDAVAGKTILFDGQSAHSSAGTAAAIDLSLLESLGADLPENIIADLVHGSTGSLIGKRFQAGQGNTATFTDVYKIISFNKLDLLQGGPQAKFLYVDSETLLPRAIRYTRKGSPGVTETIFSGWRAIGRNNVPAEIRLVQNGRTVFTFDIAATALQSAANDGLLSHL